MSLFNQAWLPWESWGHLVFWLLVAAAVELVVYNLNRWRKKAA